MEVLLKSKWDQLNTLFTPGILFFSIPPLSPLLGFIFIFNKIENCRFKDFYVDIDFGQMLDVHCRKTCKKCCKSTEAWTATAHPH